MTLVLLADSYIASPLRITESQHGRGWQGPLWVTQPNPLPKQGHPEQGAQDRGQTGWKLPPPVKGNLGARLFAGPARSFCLLLARVRLPAQAEGTRHMEVNPSR